jgi:tetratricopeptide repeat protein 8
MDPLFMACSLFRRRKFEECAKITSEILEKNSYDQAAWLMKMRSLTEQVYVDEIEVDDEGISEMLDENAIAQISRPGTSLRTPGSSQASSLSRAMRLIDFQIINFNHFTFNFNF